MSALERANKASTSTSSTVIVAAVAAASVAIITGVAYTAAYYAKIQHNSRADKTKPSTSRGVEMTIAEGEEVVAAAPPASLTMALAKAGSKALVVCPHGEEEAVMAGSWAAESRGAGAAVSVGPPEFLATHSKSAAGSYDIIVVENAVAGDGQAVGGVLGEVLKLLQPGGKVAVVLHSNDEAASTVVKREMAFSGFIDVSQSNEDSRVLLCQRPAWEVGASAPVRLSFGSKKSSAVNGNAVEQKENTVSKGSEAKKAWKLALDGDEGDGVGMEADLVDEDALLEAAAPVVKRATESDANGCATKRRACKDCSCGRAEMDAAGELDLPRPKVSLENVDDVVTSACGNCSKGDAFRCGGCPFLGKPAFEKGQEKLIMLADLDNQQDD